jgi:hypothetical protein
MTSIFNTSEVITGRVNRIINFLNSSSEFFIAIGKPTPWDNSFGLSISDINPPFPNEDEKEIIEPIIYKRIQIGVGSNSIASAASNKLQCSDFNNNIDILGSTVLVNQSPATQNFTFYSLQDLINNNGQYKNYPEFIYIQGEISDTDYTTNDWRVSALYTKLFFNTGVPTNLSIYTPSQVKGGLLHYLTYNTPVLRQSGKAHNFEYIINV